MSEWEHEGKKQRYSVKLAVERELGAGRSYWQLQSLAWARPGPGGEGGREVVGGAGEAEDGPRAGRRVMRRTPVVVFVGSGDSSKAMGRSGRLRKGTAAAPALRVNSAVSPQCTSQSHLPSLRCSRCSGSFRPSSPPVRNHGVLGGRGGEGEAIGRWPGGRDDAGTSSTLVPPRRDLLMRLSIRLRGRLLSSG